MIPSVDLQAGTILYRAGEARGPGPVWFSTEERIAESYAETFGRDVVPYVLIEPVKLPRFRQLWEVKMLLVKWGMNPRQLQDATSIELAIEVCKNSFDGWYIDAEQHLTPGKYGPTLGPTGVDVMLCHWGEKATAVEDFNRMRREFPKTFGRLKWAYHATASDRLDLIRRYGLVPGASPIHSVQRENEADRGFLFFRPTLDEVLAYGDVALRFPWPADTVRHQNWTGRYTGCFKTASRIPPEDIEMLADGEWVPLL